MEATTVGTGTLLALARIAADAGEHLLAAANYREAALVSALAGDGKGHDRCLRQANACLVRALGILPEVQQ